MPDVHIETVEPAAIAVVRGRANAGNLGARIEEGLDRVWAHLRKTGIKTAGRNVVVYLEPENGTLFLTDEGVPVEIGVEVGDDFEPSPEVVLSATPSGRAAIGTHFGAYDQLPMMHGTVSQWCRDNGQAMAGTNWEVYGDMVDAPTRARVDVYYLLK